MQEGLRAARTCENGKARAAFVDGKGVEKQKFSTARIKKRN